MSGKRIEVTFVVMAGGRGERLWPLVRRDRPKVTLSPDGRHSLLRTTIERLRRCWPKAQWLIVTTEGQQRSIRQCLPRRLREAVLVEPQGKNTAAVITLAAVALATRNPQRVMVVVPADHWIDGEAAYRRCIRRAIQAALEHDTIATIGIRPSSAHTGLGYLCAGEPLAVSSSPRVFRLARFVEKPTSARARRLIRRPHTYWNSGTFIGTADKFLEYVTEWLPGHTRRLVPLVVSRHAPRALSRTATPLDLPSLAHRARTAYRMLQAVSFDYGVMGHMPGGVVVEGRFRWADLGSWDVWVRTGRTNARTLLIKSRGVYAVSEEPHLVATIGLHDLLVVRTPTATLICPQERSQDVREVVGRIAARKEFTAFR